MLLPEQLELVFTRSTITNGEDVDLAQRARELLRIHGAARIANEVRVEWNARLKSCAGRADYRHKLISLNPRLRELHTASSRSESDVNITDCLKQSVTENAIASDRKRSVIVPDEIERTFLHELAHLLAQFRGGRKRVAPHGSEWREACRDLGIGDEKRCHNLPFPIRERIRRFLYKCPNCAETFPRVRKIRRAIACLACCRAHNDGEFDPRFRLRLCSGGL